MKLKFLTCAIVLLNIKSYSTSKVTSNLSFIDSISLYVNNGHFTYVKKSKMIANNYKLLDSIFKDEKIIHTEFFYYLKKISFIRDKSFVYIDSAYKIDKYSVFIGKQFKGIGGSSFILILHKDKIEITHFIEDYINLQDAIRLAKLAKI